MKLLSFTLQGPKFRKIRSASHCPIISTASTFVTITSASLKMPERLGLSSASMLDLTFCEKKTFYDNFEFYIADVILHLKTCGLCVRLRGRVLFPSATEIRKLHCFNMDLYDILWNLRNWIGNAARPTLLTHRKCRKNTQHIDLLKLISEVYISMFRLWLNGNI